MQTAKDANSLMASGTMQVLIVGAAMLTLAGATVGAIKYLEHRDYKRAEALVGSCVDVPPFAHAKVVGLKENRIGRGVRLEYVMKFTEAGGARSMSDELVEPIMSARVVDCGAPE